MTVATRSQNKRNRHVLKPGWFLPERSFCYGFPPLPQGCRVKTLALFSVFRSSVLAFRGRVFAFPITCDDGDVCDRRATQIRRASNCHRERAATAGSRTIQIGEAHFAALCLRPSATDPTPLDVLLKAKVKPQFDRPVTERSKLFFRVFQRSNLAQFQACFLVSGVRSAEGRNI